MKGFNYDNSFPIKRELEPEPELSKESIRLIAESEIVISRKLDRKYNLAIVKKKNTYIVILFSGSRTILYERRFTDWDGAYRFYQVRGEPDTFKKADGCHNCRYNEKSFCVKHWFDLEDRCWDCDGPVHICVNWLIK